MTDSINKQSLKEIYAEATKGFDGLNLSEHSIKGLAEYAHIQTLLLFSIFYKLDEASFTHGVPLSTPDPTIETEPSKTDDEILDVPDGTIIGAGEGVHVHKGEVMRGTGDTFYLRVNPTEPTININNLFQDFINHDITIWIQDNGLANRPDSDGS